MWNICLAKGKVAEAKVAKHLLNKGYEVEDVSENKLYQGKDTDFLATKNGVSYTIEVKGDDNYEQTGNVCVEEYQHLEKGTLGWRYYCEADFLWFVAGKKAYIVRREDMFEYIDDCMEYQNSLFSNDLDWNMATKPLPMDLSRVVRSTNIPDYEGRTGRIWLVNLENFKKYYHCQEVIL